MLKRLFRPRPARLSGQALYAAAVAQARSPELYGGLGVQDTVEGRFEAYTLHVMLILDRLRGNGPQAAETAQALFDAYVRGLDDALRELGVGDLSVGKKMRRLGEAFYGRARSYTAAFEAADGAELSALLRRTLYDGVTDPPLPAMEAYVARQRAALAKQPLEAILEGGAAWSAN